MEQRTVGFSRYSCYCETPVGLCTSPCSRHHVRSKLFELFSFLRQSRVFNPDSYPMKCDVITPHLQSQTTHSRNELMHRRSMLLNVEHALPAFIHLAFNAHRTEDRSNSLLDFPAQSASSPSIRAAHSCVSVGGQPSPVQLFLYEHVLTHISPCEWEHPYIVPI